MPSRPPSVDEEDRRRCRLVAAPMSAERALLQRLITGPVSGDALARENGETRAAVWKRIESLREAGVAIQAQPGRGYALAQPVDLLDADAIVMAMPDSARARLTGLEIVWSIDSTNSRSEEHTSELQSLMRLSYAVFCLKK